MIFDDIDKIEDAIHTNALIQDTGLLILIYLSQSSEDFQLL